MRIINGKDREGPGPSGSVRFSVLGKGLGPLTFNWVILKDVSIWCLGKIF